MCFSHSKSAAVDLETILHIHIIHTLVHSLVNLELAVSQRALKRFEETHIDMRRTCETVTQAKDGTKTIEL